MPGAPDSAYWEEYGTLAVKLKGNFMFVIHHIIVFAVPLLALVTGASAPVSAPAPAPAAAAGDDVSAVAGGAVMAAEKAPTRKIVLIAGKDSHGATTHAHTAGVRLLKQHLDAAGIAGIRTEVVTGGWPAEAKTLDDAAAILLFSDGWGAHPWTRPERLKKIAALMDRGVGLVVLHYAVAPPAGAQAKFTRWIGGYYKRDYSKNPVSEVEVAPATAEHPISRGWKAYTAKDEFYYRIWFGENDKRLVPILTAGLPKNKPNREVLAWAVQRADGGRGFGFTGGHFHRNWQIESFRQMVLNAIVWTAGVDVPADGVGAKAERSPR